MASKRSHEGYLLIDHRNSPGLTDAEVAKAGLPIGAGRGLFEAPTFTCSHCQSVVVLNPLRTRDRGYCRKCDHYVCDTCTTALSASGICKPFKEVIYEAMVAADKSLLLGERNG